MSNDAIIDDLKEILKDGSYFDLTLKGDKVTTDLGEYETVEVIEVDSGRWMQYLEIITRVPDGRHFLWKYASGLTENQEDEGPWYYGEPELQEVTSREIVVTKIVWDKIKTEKSEPEKNDSNLWDN